MDVNAITKSSAAVKVPEAPSAAPAPATAPSVRESAAGPSGSAAQQGDMPPLKSDAARELVEEIQQQLNLNNIRLNFSTYGTNNSKISVTVMEKDTGKVIREIPPQELQNLQAKLEELAGLIFNKRV